MENALVKKTGFNWLAFLFNSAYYAGKGKVKKGVMFALFAWLPIFMIPIGIYCGLKANNELEAQEFNWKNAIGVAAFQVVVGFVLLSGLKK